MNGSEVAKSAANGLWSQIKSMFLVDDLLKYVSWENLAKVVTSLIAILIFWAVYRGIRHLIKKAAEKTLQKKTVNYITKAVSYCFYVIIVMYILGLFGINFRAIWGAAGIAGVAIGFAAQTSVSNLISGIFVITDKAMKLGDYIEVDGIAGTVDSVGIISVKIRTPDNQIIRVPNSTIINSKLINYSTLKYRRYVFEISVDYSTDLDKAIEVLLSVPARCPTVITDKTEYAPAAFCTTPGESGINMVLAVWCMKDQIIKTKGDVCLNAIKAFREAGINIPFNRMDVTLLNDSE